ARRDDGAQRRPAALARRLLLAVARVAPDDGEGARGRRPRDRRRPDDLVALRADAPLALGLDRRPGDPREPVRLGPRDPRRRLGPSLRLPPAVPRLVASQLPLAVARGAARLRGSGTPEPGFGRKMAAKAVV